jgi:DNA replication protein DnaC
MGRHLSNDKPRTCDGWLALLKGLSARLGSGFLFALIGGHGRGKTQLGCDLMMLSTDNLKSAEYCTAMGFFLELKGTFRRDSEDTELSVVESFCRPRLLVIDEFEKRGDSQWANDLLFEVLNRRYGMKRDTLLLSNLDRTTFERLIGPPLASRLTETGGIVECPWSSFRTPLKG